MSKFIAYLLIFIVCATISQAATIQGSVYDLSLEKKINAIIEINTEPTQRFIVKDGTYSIKLPEGEYEIRAYYIENNKIISSTKEDLIIKSEGDYKLDLFLFPETESSNYTYLTIGVILILLAISIILIKKRKKKKIQKEIKEEPKEILPNDLEGIISIIKENGGRITQKELRKKVTLSEAKISLMISELEDKGKIKKIKKGRGNIIVLK